MKKRILIAENDEYLRHALTQLLELEGFTIAGARLATLVIAPIAPLATGPTPGINPTAFFARPPRKEKKPGSPR